MAKEDPNLRARVDSQQPGSPTQRPREMSRRTFVSTASAAMTAFAIVPRHVLGGPGHVPPSERINVAYIGLGTQGIRQLIQALPKTELRIAAVCDPNKDSTDYIEWHRHEIRDKISIIVSNRCWL